MDPQQRLLLEVAWEALEDAGQLPAALAGSQAGVFVAMMTTDYQDLQWYLRDPATIDLHAVTGGYRSVAAGRIAYALDLRGPCVSIDTHCSSSLVAVHLACQSLRSGECPLAVVGAANLVLLPQPGLGFSDAGMLAPGGRCRFADAGADGFVRKGP